jgi:hypothetical protein
MANIDPSGTITLPATIVVGDELIITNMSSVLLTIADNGKNIQYQGINYTGNVTLTTGETIHLVGATTNVWAIVND